MCRRSYRNRMLFYVLICAKCNWNRTILRFSASFLCSEISRFKYLMFSVCTSSLLSLSEQISISNNVISNMCQRFFVNTKKVAAENLLNRKEKPVSINKMFVDCSSMCLTVFWFMFLPCFYMFGSVLWTSTTATLSRSSNCHQGFFEITLRREKIPCKRLAPKFVDLGKITWTFSWQTENKSILHN